MTNAGGWRDRGAGIQKELLLGQRRWVALTHWVPPRLTMMNYVSLLCVAMPVKALFEKKICCRIAQV